MIQSSCPSCGSPITFPHGAVRAVVCGACGSTVVRDDLGVHDIGRRSPILRELSPIQVGARGEHGGVAFAVIGGVRKGRARVRWNEWYLQFADGSTGWLGEGNGQFFLFSHAVKVSDGPGLSALQPGVEVQLGGQAWVVGEAGEAAVIGADGALPMIPRGRLAYADLKARDGRFGTYDLSESPPLLWVGRVVELPDLRMEGLRPFAGWSDPALVNFAGPEITAVRSLTCPSCNSAIELRAPGQAQRLYCAACGAALETVDGAEGVSRIVSAGAAFNHPHHLALGARGDLDGAPFQIIGCLVRYVIEDGQRWHWHEYLAWNPYRGYRWLVRDTSGRWTVIKLLDRAPEQRGDARLLRPPGEKAARRFAWKQGGEATVSSCLGEFTWEVAAGDVAMTADYGSGNLTLSQEVSGRPGDEAQEEVWSLGRPLSSAEAASFGLTQPVAVDGRVGQILLVAFVIFFLFFALCMNDMAVDGGGSGGYSSGGWSSGK